MKEWIQKIRERRQRGENLALVTVTARYGSAPRGAGARMLVGSQGRIWGTVGGGLIERQAEQIAMEMLECEQKTLDSVDRERMQQNPCGKPGGKSSFVREFCLDADNLNGIGMVCGGDVGMAFHNLSQPDEAFDQLLERAAAMAENGSGGWLVSEVGEPSDSAKKSGTWLLLDGMQTRFHNLSTEASDCAFFEAEGRRWFAQRLAPEGRVLLYGAGHVARELTAFLERLNFRYIVMDDRPEFSKPEDFPGAEKVICLDFHDILDAYVPGAGDYAVVMTHGHGFDLEVQRQLLSTPAGYIGVMGSRKKKAFVFEKLKESGFTDRDLERIITPVGLPLGGETPAEIALSIAAQLVRLRAERGQGR